MKARKTVLAVLLLALCACQGAQSRPGSGGSAGSASPQAAADGRPLQAAAANGTAANGTASDSVTADVRAMIMGQQVTGTISVDTAGRCAGRVVSEQLGTAEFLSDGDRAWVKAGGRLWGDQLAARIGDRYVAGAVSQAPFSSLVFFCDRVSTAALSGTPVPQGMTEQASSSVDGVRTVTYGDAEGAVVEVAESGTAHVTRFTAGRDSEPYEFAFRDYGRPVAFTAPLDTVDLSAVLALGGSAG